MRSAGLLLLGIMSASCAARTDASVQQRYRAELDEGRWAEAYVLSGELLCDAESLELARELVQLWDRVGRPGEPQQNVDCTLGDTTTRYMDALAAAVREDYDRSATLLRAAAKSASRPQKAELRFREGVVLAMGNRPSDAVAALEGASVADPRRVDVRLALASARLDALGPEPAIETLKGILSLTPSSRELKRAREILNRAVRAGEPKMEPALAVEISNLLGAIEKDQVSSETALRLRERTGEGAHPKLLMVSGLVLMKLGRLAEGSHALVAAASANPLDAAALRSLGTTLFTAGQVEMALPHLREAARRDPFDADTLKTLAEGSAAVGDVQT
ncbi:MAG: tetratricopeptide repeat protein, partial [Myxococcota bacterium]